MALDPQQQAQLYAAKLRSLVRNRLGFELDDARGLSDGAIGESDDASAVAYLVEESPRRSLGRAIAAGIDRDADTVHLLCASEAGLVARRASAFARDIRVWEIRDTELVAASPQPHVVSEAPSADVLGLSADIVAAGADPVVEHGILRGEVRGLEIVRVELFDGVPELRVGVGDFDREAFGLLHGAQPKMDAIAEVVSIVTEQRRPGAPLHPLNRIANERWLRSLLIDRPDRIGFSELAGTEPPVERKSVKAVAPAVAVGVHDGVEMVVVVSTGIDLELLPYAADARMRTAPDAPLVVVVPERDAHPITQRLADALAEPARVVTVDNDWRSWS